MRFFFTLVNCYEKTYYSERARNIVESGNLSKDEVNGKIILFNSNGSYDDLYREYYEEGNILIIEKKEELFTTIFNKFRKNSYPVDIIGIPDIIGGCEGLLFYKNGKTINYL